jgi:DNA-binding NarL/FixJ family response regulator
MRALIVEDQSLMRLALRTVLAEVCQARGIAPPEVEEAGSVGEALQLKGAALDLILLDLGLPDRDEADPLAVLDRVVAAFADARTVVVSANEENPRLIRASIDRGASGFFPKSYRSDRLKDALSCVLDDGIYLPEFAVRALAPAAAAVDSAPLPLAELEQLTPRQREVALLAAKNLPLKLIARELGADISPGTVKAHLAAIYEKLGVTGKTDLVLRFQAARFRGRRQPD